MENLDGEKYKIPEEKVVVDDFEALTKIVGHKNTKGEKKALGGHIDKQRPLNPKELTGVSDNEFGKMVRDIKSGKMEKYIK